MRPGFTRSKCATRLTGIVRSIKAMANASNSKVKPLPGRAHGTPTVCTLPSRVRNARYGTVQIALVLEEVQMLPAPLDGVVYRAQRAAGVGKPAAFGKANMEVQCTLSGRGFAEFKPLDLPRCLQPKGQAE